MSAARASSSPPSSPPGSSFRSYEQTQKAIDAIQNKTPIEDIDFTVHMMEDGTEVSTQERVCKGIQILIRFAY
jgi:serine/threonine-protein phosphatase 2B catalytic subunit